MKVTYDKDVDALNIQFQSGDYETSEEISKGIIVDYSKEDKIMDIEILDASKRVSLKEIDKIER